MSIFYKVGRRITQLSLRLRDATQFVKCIFNDLAGVGAQRCLSPFATLGEGWHLRKVEMDLGLDVDLDLDLEVDLVFEIKLDFELGFDLEVDLDLEPRRRSRR